MSTSAIGRRYARALLDLAGDNRVVPKVTADLQSFLDAWNSSDELRALFENPAISGGARVEVLDSLGRRMALSKETLNTLKLLADRGRLRHLPEIAESFSMLAQEREGRVVAEVTSAAPLPPSLEARLKAQLEKAVGKQVVLVKKQDADLIGGVVTRVGDKVFDGSVRHRLQQIQERLGAP